MLKKSSFIISVSMTMLIMASILVFGQTQKLSDADRTLLINTLNASKVNLAKAVSGLTSEQLNFKSAPDKWSILECAEHLTETEPFLFGMITKTVLTTPAVEPGKNTADEKVTAMVTDRSKKFPAPDPIKPTGRWKTIDATMVEFDNRRGQTLEFVKTTQIPLRSHLYGFSEATKQDGVQWFLYLSGHVDRHIAQINEIKSNPAFPKK